MEITTLIGYFGALLIGLVLGLIGGGGSILTIPILVYVFSISPVLATAYSLFVVGSASLVGALRNAQKGLVDFKTGLVFAIPALTTVFLIRKFLIPIIPQNLFTIGDFTLTKDVGIMVFFAIVMLLASYSMIKKRTEPVVETEFEEEFSYLLIVLQGIGVGVLTGIVGAGGGFLIIPALVVLAKVPMKKAVATSLMIIAINSLLGFLGDVGNTPIDWPFLLVFTGIAIFGIFIGIYLNKFIEGPKLKKAFGWFVLIMGIYIILKELL
ncbi:sulfite exporter TauE/SafE family protein [Putridiphycobacter roseus]|uniref:Probable membrane transporter protein n=1 Tax=Putridiphycobacter roseus TaxID=2219161 RepID=A0A2W1NGS8_9FLAO|nr:sulfite exporter TauE/SafE family protein [Putridiphycobacter roseus]PZE18705.1 sulfite exporter TauE/SafE family protein [Putridiphycobacter roseus]